MFWRWGSQDQESQARPQSWYPPSVDSSPTSSRPSTPGARGDYANSSFSASRPLDRLQIPSHVSPAAAADIIPALRDKSVDELRKILTDKEEYNRFLLSLDQVKTQNHVKDELEKETLQLARENMDKEPMIMELRNQCRIIRTTELAAAQERLNDLEKRKNDIMKCYSSASLANKLQEAMNKADEESEALHQQLLNKEIELGVFVQRYKKLRNAFHRRALTHIAAKTSQP